MDANTAEEILIKLQEILADLDWPQARLIHRKVEEIHELVAENSEIEDLISDAILLGIDLTGIRKKA